MSRTLVFDLLAPAVLCLTALWGMAKRVDVYGALVEGAGEGLGIMARIFPAMVALMTAVAMLRASGLPELAGELLAPFFTRLGVPEETIPLLLIRPVSGSGALGAGAELIRTWGPDSAVGRTAAVMLGSSETTFYTIAVYFGSAGVKRTRYAIPAALCADLAAFLAAAWAVELLF